MKKKNAFILFMAAFIWGTAFVAQSVGMEYLGPFAFNGIRSFVGCAALIPCIMFLQKISPEKKETAKSEQEVRENRKMLLLGGVCCGICLFAASSLQQVGMQYTTVGKAGFITAFYIVLVPVLGIFLKKKVGWKVWLAVVVAICGLYFLCITESFTI